MEVILAESAGFCFGVKRAVDKVYEQIETGKKIYTYSLRREPSSSDPTECPNPSAKK